MARYENTKTGAVVDSPFKLSGENWKLVKNSGKPKPEKKQAEKNAEEDGVDGA